MTTSFFTEKKIGIIGIGKMGRAIYLSLAKVHPLENLIGYDPSNSDIAQVQMVKSLQEIVEICDVIFLAIKPGDLKSLKLKLDQTLLISVLAGVSIETLSARTKAKKVVRAMPNLPIQVGKGIVSWVASKAVTDKLFLKYLFCSMGVEIELQQEELLHSATAISGSGPAYFFYLCERLMFEAKALGFSSDEAKKLAEMTFIGSAALLDESGKSAEIWRHAVTSKGGVTEAALHELQSGTFDETFKGAIQHAKNRSEHLSAENSSC